jgi:hypothetical protein
VYEPHQRKLSNEEIQNILDKPVPAWREGVTGTGNGESNTQQKKDPKQHRRKMGGMQEAEGGKQGSKKTGTQTQGSTTIKRKRIDPNQPTIDQLFKKQRMQVQDEGSTREVQEENERKEEDQEQKTQTQAQGQSSRMPTTKRRARGQKRRRGELQTQTRQKEDPVTCACTAAGEEEVLSEEEQKEQAGLFGTRFTSLKELWKQAAVEEKGVTIVGANVRSSQEMRKIYLLAREMEERGTKGKGVVVMALQETWLRSTKARKEISQEKGLEGWVAHRLDRSRVQDHRSGGIAVYVRGEGCTFRSRIIDEMGAMRTDIIREDQNQDGSKGITKVAVINVYVPTGKNKLERDRERTLERRVLGAVKNATEGLANVIVTGDWNHLTKRWYQFLNVAGLERVGRGGVMVMMAKGKMIKTEGGYCMKVKEYLPTDHGAVAGTFQCSKEERVQAREKEEKVDMKAVRERGEELKEKMRSWMKELPDGSPSERMRWVTKRIKEEAIAITKKAQKEREKTQGRTYAPKRLNKIYDKLRGKVPLAKGETKEQLRRQEEKERRRWKNKQKSKWIEKQRKEYEESIRKVFRRLKGNAYDPMYTQTYRGEEYTDTAKISELAEKVIGSRWKEQPKTKVGAEKWEEFLKPRKGDTLEGIDTIPSEEEIMKALKKTCRGKATHSDKMSRELLELMPEEVVKVMVDYIQHVFATG